MKITTSRRAVYEVTLIREDTDRWPVYDSALGHRWDIHEMAATVTIAEDGTAFAEGPDISRAQAIEGDGTPDILHGVIAIYAGYSGPLENELREAAVQAALRQERNLT